MKTNSIQLDLPFHYQPKKIITILEKHSGLIFKLNPSIIDNHFIAKSDKVRHKYLVRYTDGKFKIV